ncbi:MAG: sulfoxide reductase heme-binding subunit YedZ [Gemmatimonadaceae bacterium]|nr:sulfoxide reductase heme-binding subunit YedZ [Gemmatimonadaceae bacterium]
MARLGAFREPPGFGPVLFVVLSLPGVLAIAGTLSDILAGTRWFGADPVKEVEHYLGRWTLRLVLASLCVTPLRKLTGWSWLAKYRRTVGLFAFAYVTLHWIAYALLDVQLDWATLVTDLLDRPYIYLGMAALLILGALAATSTKGMMRRMGGRNWSRLHSLIYVAAVLGVVHFAMAQKKDITAPLEYGAVLAVLLGWRLVQWVRQRRPTLAAS